jgi:hypothetical protein
MMANNARTGGYGGMTDNNPQAARDEQLKIMLAELNNPKYQQDAPWIQREIQRLGGTVPSYAPAASAPAEPTPGAQLVGAMGSPEANAAMAESAQGGMFAPTENTGAQLIGPMGLPPAAAAMDAARGGGAFSQLAAAPEQPQAAVQERPGALSQVAQQDPFKLPTPQEALAMYMPQDNSQGRYLAMAAGFGKETQTGSFGAQLGNVAASVAQQKMEQDKLRMQYLPQIMQQVAAQQMLVADARNAAAIAARYAPGQPQGTAPQAQSGNPSMAQGSPVQPGQAQGQTGQQGPGQAQGAGQTQPGPAAQSGAVGAPVAAGNGFAYPPTQAELDAIQMLPAGTRMKAMSDLLQKHSELTGPALLAAQAGYPPGTPGFQQYMQAAAAKGNYIPPTSLRPGSPYIGSDMKLHTTPSAAPQGYQNVVDANDKWSTIPVAGGLDAEQASSRAKALGAAGAKPTTVYDPVTHQPVFSNAALDAQRGNGTTPPGTQQGVAPALAPGVAQGDELAQKDLSTRYSTLRDQNAQAQKTSSYLTEMQTLASKAIVGPMSDKINYLNNLLAASGISERATDRATAGALFDKYANNIVVSQGVGSLGTDAARNLVQAANPNAHMTQAAIDEAATVLKGASVLTQAKLQALAPHGNSHNPVGYQQAEQTFDTLSDPILWKNLARYRTLTPGSDAAKAFITSTLKSDPDFLSKMQTLHDIKAY